MVINLKILIINKDVKKIFNIINFLNDTYSNSICYYSTLLSTIYDENLNDIDILIIELDDKLKFNTKDITYINGNNINSIVILESNNNSKVNSLKNVSILHEPYTFFELKNRINNILNKLKI